MKIKALIVSTGLLLTAGATQASDSYDGAVNARVPYDDKIPGIVCDSRDIIGDESSEDMDETSEFFKQGKSWIFRREEFDYDAFCFKVKTERITVVDYFDYEGLRVAKLLHERIEDNKQYFSACYVQNGIIYYSPYSEKKLQFFPQLDFNASPGQELENYGKEPGEKTKYVSDVLPMVIRGVERRVYVVRYISGKDICGYWIEGIGTTVRTASMTSYLYPAGAPSIKVSEVREADPTGSDLIACYEDGECIYSIDDLKDIVAETEMFREDLRWNYVMPPVSMGYPVTISRMKFEGCREYEQKTYHMLVNDYCLDRPVTGEHYGRWFRKEMTNPILVRAESGKIYARLYNWGKTEESDPEYLDEIPLYDFCCEEGDTFQSAGNAGELMQMKVYKVEEVKVDGALRKLMYVYPLDWNVPETDEDPESEPDYDSMYKLLEGVGIVDGGTISGFRFYFTTGSGFPALSGSPAGFPMSAPYLTSLTDTAGKIVYPSRDEEYTDRIILGHEADMIWEYATVTDLPPCDHTPYGPSRIYTLSSYSFDGLEFHGDHIYKKLYLKGEKIWKVMDKGNGELECTEPEYKELNDYVGSFREDNGNLYMRPGENEISYIKYPYTDFSKRPLAEDEELLLFPNSMNVGEIIDVWFDGYLAQVQVFSKDKDEVQPWRMDLRISGIGSESGTGIPGSEGDLVFDRTYVSGVGNIGHGTFSNPKPSDGESQYLIYEPRTFFNNLYRMDDDGNPVIMYKGADISPTNPGAIGDIASDYDSFDNAPAAVYDLCGRTVLTGASRSDLRNLPKGIYIYKGRKIII